MLEIANPGLEYATALVLKIANESSMVVHYRWLYGWRWRHARSP